MLGLIGLRSCRPFAGPPTKWKITERKIKSKARCFDGSCASALDIAPLDRIALQAAPGDLYPQTLRPLLGDLAHEAIAIPRAQIRSNLLPDIFIETQNAFVRQWFNPHDAT